MTKIRTIILITTSKFNFVDIGNIERENACKLSIQVTNEKTEILYSFQSRLLIGREQLRHNFS